jgi:hypothetical protein
VHSLPSAEQGEHVYSPAAEEVPTGQIAGILA